MFLSENPSADPRWASPIKAYVRQQAQAKAVNEVVAALKPTSSQLAAIMESEGGTRRPNPLPVLRVVNGMSTPSSLTTSTQETVKAKIDGLPSPRGAGWPIGAGPNVLPAPPKSPPIEEHPEADHPTIDGLASSPILQELHRQETVKAIPTSEPPMPPPKPKPINPSLSTLEKAASARIYFENLYFPLMKNPPSREQRRVAMEGEMVKMGMSEPVKEKLREQWRRNETDYLREQRRKVDVSAFKELKIIGHGMLPNWIAVLEATPSYPPALPSRCLRSRLAREREEHRSTVRNETTSKDRHAT